MIQGGTLEVLVVIDLIPEEEAIVAVAAVVTVKARGEANLQRVSLHGDHQLNLLQDLLPVLPRDQGPVLYQDQDQDQGLLCLCVIKAPKDTVLAEAQKDAVLAEAQKDAVLAEAQVRSDYC